MTEPKYCSATLPSASLNGTMAQFGKLNSPGCDAYAARGQSGKATGRETICDRGRATSELGIPLRSADI